METRNHSSFHRSGNKKQLQYTKGRNRMLVELIYLNDLYNKKTFLVPFSIFKFISYTNASTATYDELRGKYLKDAVYACLHEHENQMYQK